MNRATLFASLLVLSVSAAIGQGSAGKIAFSSNRADKNNDLYVMNVDGTGIQRVTYDPADDVRPSLSPDGTTIVFSSNRGVDASIGGAFRPSDIYTIKVDGTGLKRLTSMGGTTDYPVWSPDGTQIAFVQRVIDTGSTHVFKIPAAGGTPVQLAAASTSYIEWNTTPTGELISYFAESQGNSSPAATMKPDGSSQQIANRLPTAYSPDGTKYLTFDNLQSMTVRNTSDGAEVGTIGVWSLNYRVAFSADSKKVIFAGYYPENDGNYNSHIYSANVNGTSLTDLTRASGSDDYPSCGAGSTVTVQTPATGYGRLVMDGYNGGIYVMNPTGWGMQLLEPSNPALHPKGIFRHPKWSRDGTRIAMDDGSDIYTMAYDGTDLQQVTHVTAGYSITPTWNSKGDHLAFENQDGAPFFYHERIHSIRLDGTEEVTAGTQDATNSSPDWQPAAPGSLGAIAHFNGGAYLESSIQVDFLDAGGSTVPFTNSLGGGNAYDADGDGNGLFFSGPAWSATGTRLGAIRTERRFLQVNSTRQRVSNCNIVMADPDGANVVNLTGNPLATSGPVYSSLSFAPNGTELSVLESGTLVTLALDGSSRKAFFANAFTSVHWGANFNYAARDAQAPVVAVTSPSGPTTRKQLAVTGTVDDSGPFPSGAAVVWTKFQRVSDGKYWNPAQAGSDVDKWGVSAEQIPADLGPVVTGFPARRTWAIGFRNLPASVFMPTGSYRVYARSIDNAGNLGGEVSFTFGISNPGQLDFSSDNYSIDEATGVATPGAVTIVRRGGSDGTVTVDYRAQDNGDFAGFAKAGADFTLPSGTLTFGPGETSKVLPLQILNDALLEGTETIFVELSNPTGGADFGDASTVILSPKTIGITLVDDEVALAGTFAFRKGTLFARADAGTVDVTIDRVGGSIAADVSFSMYKTAGPTALRFTDVSQVVHFGASETSKVVSVPLLNTADGLANQYVGITLTFLTQYKGGQIVITDKDFVPASGTLKFSQSVYTAKDDGNGVEITIQRQAPLTGEAYFFINTDSNDPGNAVSPADYSVPFSFRSFADGVGTAQTILVDIPAGAAAAGGKEFHLQLQDGQGYALDVTTVRIVHDSSGPGVFSFAEALTTGAEGTTVTLTVNRLGGSTGAANVPFTIGGTATKGKDYTVDATSPLHFADGQTSKVIHVALLTDAVEDGLETVVFTLGNPNIGTLGDNPDETVSIEDGPTGGGTLTVNLQGSGSVTAGFLGGSQRKIGATYKVTAKPAAGYLFAGWSGGSTSTKPALTFVMTAGLSLTANFVENPFTAVTGIYAGFAKSSDPLIDPSLLSVTLSGSGGFSGVLTNGLTIRSILPAKLARTLPFKGAFTSQGAYAREGTIGGISYTIQLQHTPADGGRISGTVTIGGKSFSVDANRAAYSKSHPTLLAGKYTLAFVPGPDQSSPRGHGVATVSIKPAGTIEVKGTLGDGAAFSASGPLTTGDSYSLFAPLYLNTTGQLTGKLVVAPNNSPGTTDISANIHWIRPAAVADGKVHAYQAGFATQLTGLASVYAAPAAGLNVFGVPLSNLNLSLQDGSSGSPAVIRAATLDGLSKLKYVGADKLTGGFAEATGLFDGKFTISNSTSSAAAVMLQKQGVAVGFSLKADLSSDLSLAP